MAGSSVTLQFSPAPPCGIGRANWLQINPGEGCFVYLRFYGPTEAYLNESYPLQDIKPVK